MFLEEYFNIFISRCLININSVIFYLTFMWNIQRNICKNIYLYKNLHSLDRAIVIEPNNVIKTIFWFFIDEKWIGEGDEAFKTRLWYIAMKMWFPMERKTQLSTNQCGQPSWTDRIPIFHLPSLSRCDQYILRKQWSMEIIS